MYVECKERYDGLHGFEHDVTIVYESAMPEYVRLTLPSPVLLTECLSSIKKLHLDGIESPSEMDLNSMDLTTLTLRCCSRLRKVQVLSRNLTSVQVIQCPRLQELAVPCLKEIEDLDIRPVWKLLGRDPSDRWIISTAVPEFESLESAVPEFKSLYESLELFV